MAKADIPTRTTRVFVRAKQLHHTLLRIRQDVEVTSSEDRRMRSRLYSAEQHIEDERTEAPQKPDLAEPGSGCRFAPMMPYRRNAANDGASGQYPPPFRTSGWLLESLLACARGIRVWT